MRWSFFIFLLLFGCTQELPTDTPATVDHTPGTVDDTTATADGTAKVVSGNNQFAFDMYKELSSDENLFISPWSISTALAMTYEGARGQTADEMVQTLHLMEDDSVRRSGFASLYNTLNTKDAEYQLSTANALWAEQTYAFLPDYLDTVKKFYGGKTTNLDFIGASEESRKTINTWVEDQTQDKIKDLIPKGVITPLTTLVLTNAIYFKGDWVLEFDKEKTSKQGFRTGSGTVEADMMMLTGDKAEFKYTETDDLQMIELPYKGDKLSMLVLLPNEDDISSLEKSLSAEKLNELRDELQEQRVDVYLPKFKFETKYFLCEALKAMGMPAAFSPGGADFSGMDGTRNLFISKVIHQAFVDVNEEGTEAAAATAVVMDRAIMQNAVFRADHPFIFIIQEKETGSILFLGKVADPTA